MKVLFFISLSFFIIRNSYSQEWKIIKEQKIQIQKIVNEDSTYLLNLYEIPKITQSLSIAEFDAILEKNKAIILTSNFNVETGLWSFGTYSYLDSTYKSYKVDLKENSLYKEKPDTRWFPNSFSVFTIPIKVRPSVKYIPYENSLVGGSGEEEKYNGEGKVGLTSLYLGYNFWTNNNWKYFRSGKEVVHKFAGGVFFGFTAETLNKQNLNLDPNSVFSDKSQVFLSYGVQLSYTYNDISFMLIPLGIDTGITSLSKSYVFNNKAWWGIGIGITSKQMGNLLGYN